MFMWPAKNLLANRVAHVLQAPRFLVEADRVDVEQRHLRAVLRERFRIAEAEPAGPSRDDDAVSFDLEQFGCLQAGLSGVLVDERLRRPGSRGGGRIGCFRVGPVAPRIGWRIARRSILATAPVRYRKRRIKAGVAQAINFAHGDLAQSGCGAGSFPSGLTGLWANTLPIWTGGARHSNRFAVLPESPVSTARGAAGGV